VQWNVEDVRVLSRQPLDCFLYYSYVQTFMLNSATVIVFAPTQHQGVLLITLKTNASTLCTLWHALQAVLHTYIKNVIYSVSTPHACSGSGKCLWVCVEQHFRVCNASTMYWLLWALVLGVLHEQELTSTHPPSLHVPVVTFSPADQFLCLSSWEVHSNTLHSCYEF